MYKFERITEADGAVFDAWLKDGRVGDWIGIDDWFDFFGIVGDSPEHFLIKISLGGKIIGEIELEIDDEDGNLAYIAMMVAPDEQCKGHGKRILSEFLRDVRGITGRDIKYIEAGIMPDNIASRRCFEGCGFKFTEQGHGGELLYVYENN